MKYLFLLLLSLLPRGITSASIDTRESLEACTLQALTGADAAERIVTPQHDTYTDARLGEKIQ